MTENVLFVAYALCLEISFIPSISLGDPSLICENSAPGRVRATASRSRTDWCSAPSKGSSELPETPHHGFRRRRLSAIRERVSPRRARVCATTFREGVIHVAAGFVAVGDIALSPESAKRDVTSRSWGSRCSTPTIALGGGEGKHTDPRGGYVRARQPSGRGSHRPTRAGRAYARKPLHHRPRGSRSAPGPVESLAGKP